MAKQMTKPWEGAATKKREVAPIAEQKKNKSGKGGILSVAGHLNDLNLNKIRMNLDQIDSIKSID